MESRVDEAAGGGLAIIVHAVRPDFVPDEALALLDVNSEQRRLTDVRLLLLAQQPSPAALQRTGVDSRFHHDVGYEAWEALGAWREIQYFVLDPSGSLLHRGTDLEAALRVSFVLSTRDVASPDVVLNRKDTNT